MARVDLVIPDLQIPFEHPGALKFCRYLKRHYKIRRTNVYNVGDEVDQYWAGQWPKSIEAEHTATQEFEESLDRLRAWYDEFPQMKIATSNHQMRWQRKALASDIPKFILKTHKELMDAPEGWHWQKNILVPGKHAYRIEHGDDFGGKQPHVSAALDHGISTVVGHHHTLAEVTHFRTAGRMLWAAAAGCLIDEKAYAFHYAAKFRRKPQLGALIVIDEGRLPIWIPMD